VRAIVWVEYGPPEGLRLREVAQPVPKPEEVRIRLRASGVAAGDCELRALRFSFGLRLLVRLMMGPIRPRDKILGQEFAGEVEAVGSRVSRLRVGDAVYGTTGFRFGAYAEYLCVRDRSRDGAVALKPANMTFEQAATVPTGGLEAWHFLRQAGSLRDRTVLIVGAGGGIGLPAIQIAKALGAHVTGVDTTARLEVMRGAGADRVIDFTQENFSRSPEPYDVVFDVVGRGRFADGLRAVRRGGVYLLANPSLRAILRGPWATATGRTRVVVRGAPPRVEELEYLRGLIEAGQLRAIIDRTYPLERVVEAHRYIDAGLARGRVVLTL
jgi:NADPH:quinone reductase-like Zn-dependent oxidoreductase